MSSNRVEKSPVGTQSANMRKQIPKTPGRAIAQLGNKGNLYLSGDKVYGLAETTDGDYVFCWFEGGKRKDSQVRTKNVFQVPHLDAEGRALVIGGDGREVFVVEPSGEAVCVGRLESGVGAPYFAQASWVGNGFVLGDNTGNLNVYTWSAGETPVGVGRYPQAGEGCDELRGTPEGLLITCGGSEVHVYLVRDETVRLIGDFGLQFHNTYQCVDETGRALWILPGPYVSDHGSQLELAGAREAIATRESLPEVDRAGDALALRPGERVEAASGVAESPPTKIRPPRSSQYWTYTNALLAMMEKQGRKLDQPLPGVIECLAMPMDDDLYAYIHFRAHWDVGVVAIYEAWLDAPPKLRGDVIDLGVLANGDWVYARGRKIIELSHEGDGEREFTSFESWLADVVHRTDNPTDLDPFVKAS